MSISRDIALHQLLFQNAAALLAYEQVTGERADDTVEMSLFRRRQLIHFRLLYVFSVVLIVVIEYSGHARNHFGRQIISKQHCSA